MIEERSPFIRILAVFVRLAACQRLVPGIGCIRPIRVWLPMMKVMVRFVSDKDKQGVGSGWGRNDTLSVSANHRRWV